MISTEVYVVAPANTATTPTAHDVAGSPNQAEFFFTRTDAEEHRRMLGSGSWAVFRADLLVLREARS